MERGLLLSRAVFDLRTFGLAVLTVSSVSVSRHALADFDPASGRIVLDGVLNGSFDDLASLEAFGDFNVLGHILTPVPNRTAAFVDGDAAIEGAGAFRIDDTVAGVDLSLATVADTLRGRRIEARFWYRAAGTVPIAELYYLEFGGRDLFDTPNAPFAAIGVVRFWPTGRATDDGWVEMSSGPVDFAVHGSVQAQMIRIVDERIVESAFFGLRSVPGGSALIDGLEIVDLGEAAVDPVACTLVDEASTCGASGVCLYGRCADTAIAEGSLPANARIRAEYLDYQVDRIRNFAGSRYIQSTIDAFAARIDAAKDEPLKRLWAEYRRAHAELADGHLSTPLTTFVSSVGTGACLYESDADLLPGAPIAPMVHSVLPNHPLASVLEIGDVLVAIDGEPVADWVARADRLLQYGGDQRGRDFILAPSIIEAAFRAGATLELSRCPVEVAGACTTDDVETITVETAALVQGLWSGVRPGWWFDGAECDFRFSQPVPGGGADPDFVGFVDDSALDVRTIVINGVGGDGRWMSRVRAALTDLPNDIILDERMGGGGTFEGVAALVAPFVASDEQPLAMVLPPLAPEIDPILRDKIFDCQQFGSQACGNGFILPLAGFDPPPVSRPDARIAIVNGLDVSGNDFLPYALKRRARGETRIFGAVPTYGAFGPLSRMPRVASEIVGGSFQIHDTVFLAGLADPNVTFTTGFGVEPDEVVRQKQSDALQGVDTLLTRAKAWLGGGR